MELFDLPLTTKVGRFIPKKAFDDYTKSKQKEKFKTLVQRITWTHKISPDTVNLEAGNIREIQIFHIELKEKRLIDSILNIMDKAVPYAIIFIIQYEDKIYLSTSVKHAHPTNENNAIIDWTFKSNWFSAGKNKYRLLLKESLDKLHHNFCIQLSGHDQPSKISMGQLVAYSKRIDQLKKERKQLKAAIAKCKQFNKKVELNIKLREVERLLKEGL